MTNKFKILMFITVTFLLFACIYNALFEYSLNSPRVASWWLKDTITKKEQISDKEQGERIVILSGSNGLFGFDGKVLQKRTGMPVINLALHASLDLRFYQWIAEKNIRKGDIVIIPLEYNYYSIDNPYNTWFIDNMMSWGKDYLNWLTPLEYWKFISHVDLQKVISGSWSNYLIHNGSPYKSKLHSVDEILNYKFNNTFHEYDFRSVDNYGDILAPEENKRDAIKLIEKPEKNQKGLYYMKNVELTEYGISSVYELVKSIEKLGAKPVITWPASMKTPYFSIDDPDSESMINTIKTRLAEKGLKTYCSPWSVNINPKLFYDTAYHLNKKGARIRTEAVYLCLKNENLLSPSN